MLNKAVMESFGQIFAKEGDVRLHHSSHSDIIVLIVGAVFITLPLLLVRCETAHRPLALDTEWLRLPQHADASITSSDTTSLEIFVYVFAFDTVSALDASRGRERTVALDQLFGEDTGAAF